MGTCGNTQVIPGSKNADANCNEWNNVAVEAGGGGGSPWRLCHFNMKRKVGSRLLYAKGN